MQEPRLRVRSRIRLRPSQRLTFGAPLEVSTRRSAFLLRSATEAAHIGCLGLGTNRYTPVQLGHRPLWARCSSSARVVSAFNMLAGSASTEASVCRSLAVYRRAATESRPGTARNTPLKSGAKPMAVAAPTAPYQTGRPRVSSLMPAISPATATTMKTGGRGQHDRPELGPG